MWHFLSSSSLLSSSVLQVVTFIAYKIINRILKRFSNTYKEYIESIIVILLMLLLLLDLLLHLTAPSSEHVLIHLLLSLFVLYSQTVFCEWNIRICQSLVELWNLVYFCKRDYTILLFASISSIIKVLFYFIPANRYPLLYLSRLVLLRFK